MSKTPEYLSVCRAQIKASLVLSYLNPCRSPSAEELILLQINKLRLVQAEQASALPRRQLGHGARDETALMPKPLHPSNCLGFWEHRKEKK